MRKEIYIYLVSYVFNGGSGSAIYKLKDKIKSVEDLNSIKKDIEKKSPKGEVAIMSYQLICKERVKDE